MTDIPALIVNFGILVVSGVAAVVAFVQARHALNDAHKAESAREGAVEAQRSAATALEEANTIAKDARDVMQGQDARSRERHHVEWRVIWNRSEAKWYLSNEGPDAAADVRFTATAETIDRVEESHDEIPPHRAIGIEFPVFKLAGGVPRVEWRVEWRSPLGTPHEEQGRWPRA